MTSRPILVLASVHYHGHQLYDQRLARALAAGRQVVYVDPSTTILGLGNSPDVPPSSTPSGVASLSVFRPGMMPYGRRPALRFVSGVLDAAQVWVHAVKTFRTARFDTVIFGANPVAIRALRPSRAVHVVLDDYVAGHELIGKPKKTVAKEFRMTSRKASKVVVVSPYLKELLLQRGLRSKIVPAGCVVPTEQHREPADLSASTRRRAVFVGMISDRIDLDIFTRLIDAGLDVIVVGRVQPTFSKMAEFEEIRARSGFFWLEPRTGDDLDAVIQHCQVGLIPYTESEFNRASFPLKAFEYLACGIPVVSTPLPAMTWLDSPEVRVCHNHDEFVSCALEFTRSDSPEIMRERSVKFAQRNTWAKRADAYLELLQSR